MRALLLALLACAGGGDPVAVAPSPAPIEAAECAVCGMIVTEQPAPRAQIVYRDGTRAWFCSLGELRAALAAPSPHGSPSGIYVEALPADFDPASTPTAPLAWVAAEDGWYIVGPERPMVMGLPVLSFADRPSAEAAAARLGRRAVPWSTLRDTPFNRAPQLNGDPQ